MPTRSAQTPISVADLKRYGSLVQKKYREKERLYLVEGIRLCEELFHSEIQVRTVLCVEGFGSNDQREQRLLQTMKEGHRHVVRLTAKQYERISATEHSQGVVAIAEFHDRPARALLDEHSDSTVVLLDRISDPGNLGTIVRTCAWFGVSALFLSPGCVDPYNPKVVRATMGGLFRVPFSIDAKFEDVIPEMKNRGYTVYLTQLSNSRSITEISFGKKSALVFGSESEGIDRLLDRLADERIMIPGRNVESLSVGVAAGIIIAAALQRNV